MPVFPIRSCPAAAAFWLLGCVAVRGDIYVADPSARAVIQLPGGGVPPSKFSREVIRPVGMALDREGNLYQGDLANGNVYKYTAKGSQSLFAEGFSQPFGLAFDRAGACYVAAVDGATERGSVVKITPDGTRKTVAEGLRIVRGLAFDRTGNLYVAEATTGIIHRIAPDGTRRIFATGIIFPTGLAFDAAGTLFVCSQGSSIFKVSPGGEVSVFTTNVVDPRWLAFDPKGNLYVTDVGDATGGPGHGRVYMFTPEGERTVIDDTLSYPTGLVVGNVRSGVSGIPGVDAGPDLDAGEQTPSAPAAGAQAPTATPAARKDAEKEKPKAVVGEKPTDTLKP